MLVGMLARAEGVSTATTEELYIHYHATDGQVLEVLGHDKRTGLMVVDFTKENRTPPKETITPPKTKPHIRMIAAKPINPAYVGGSGLYTAYMATR